jgi:hypothetical protein
MRETRSSGSVEGVVGNHDPYSDSKLVILDFDFGSPRLRQYISNRRCGSRQIYAPTPIHADVAAWTLDFVARLNLTNGVGFTYPA